MSRLTQQSQQRLGKFEVDIQWDVKVPMRDGTQLSGLLYLPDPLETPRPAIHQLTPYVAQTYHEVGVYFASNGYPYLVVDIRGRGNSPGEFYPNETEAEDGFDIIEWLARQSFCNGQVTATGGSYSGMTQWLAAREMPEHLSTIIPVSSPFRGVDTPVRNNLYANYSMQWLTLTAGITSQDQIFWGQKPLWGSRFRRWHESGRPFRELDSFLGMPSKSFQTWVAHPTRDDYWDRFSPSPEQYAAIDMPILTITGHYDVNQPGALEHYKRHNRYAPDDATAKHYLIIGPWNHQGTREPVTEFSGLTVGDASLLDIRQLHLDWYDWTLSDGPRPDFLRDRVAYYVMAADHWRYAPTLEAVTDHSEPLFLSADRNPTDVFRAGRLSGSPTDSEPFTFEHDPRDIATAVVEEHVDPSNVTDQRMLFAKSGKLLVFHTEPFTEPREVTGFFRADLWISIDQPDCDFRVSVHEIGLDGSSVQLSYDTIRARYRESDKEESLVSTTEPLHYGFDRFPFVSREISVGSRLRFVIEPIHSIYFQRNMNAGGVVSDESIEDARTVQVAVFADSSRPSAIHVPYGRPS
ncbi:CocE/NonD family hydrolase [Phytohabitans kaempferiae]|uniref:CocE/NonD family hydrolase n=1 Tax=Phytohabitans kaempferiae TaxID=1620943 RepID=A0ABV6MI20_9ACTN